MAQNARGPKIGVRVRPDTTGFVTELRTYLKGVVRELPAIKVDLVLSDQAKAMLAKGFKAKIHLEDEGITRQLEEIRRKLRELEQNANPTIRANANTAAANAQL